MIEPKVEQVEILGFPGCLPGTTILKIVHPFLEHSLINLILFKEFPIDNFGLLLMCLDETVWRLLVRIDLSKYELAVKLVQLVHLHAQEGPEKQTE